MSGRRTFCGRFANTAATTAAGSILAVSILLAHAGCANSGSDKKSVTASKETPAKQADAGHGHGHGEHALHNVHHIGSKLYSGAVPEGDAAFDELQAMGIKTVISVDGATPDLARAESRGMRYVHIPITYAEANKDQQLEIARAVRDLPGPIYLHCHHGKHRGPAAAASAAVLLGEVSPEEGVAFMKTAGTAAHYQGLYACVANATAVSAAAIDTAPAEFPSLRKAEGIVAAMVEVDIAYEHLNDVRAAGWKVPGDHPDLVPAAEAGRLTDNLRFSHEDPKTKPYGEEYERLMIEAIKAASDLEEGIIADAPKDKLEASWKRVAASCKDCHAGYRNKKVVAGN